MVNLSWSSQSLALGLAVFVAVLLLIEGLWVLWRERFGREARRVQLRLHAMAASRERARAEVLRRQGPQRQGLSAWLWQTPASRRLQRLRQQADVAASPAALAGSSLALAAGAMGLAALLRLPGLTIALLGLALGALPWAWLLRRRSRRLTLLTQQLPPALDLMVRALRAGHAFPTALQMVADEMPAPIASEFRTVHDEVSFGLNLQQALSGLIERAPLTELRTFVVAVLIQREAGGNLTELLANLAALIRARLKLAARVRVLSSEGRLSGWILVALPFALGGLMSAFNPDFMRPLWTDPIGITLLNGMLALMAVGVLIMRQIVRIRV